MDIVRIFTSQRRPPDVCCVYPCFVIADLNMSAQSIYVGTTSQPTNDFSPSTLFHGTARSSCPGTYLHPPRCLSLAEKLKSPRPTPVMEYLAGMAIGIEATRPKGHGYRSMEE